MAYCKGENNMVLRHGFEIVNVADEWLIIPVGDASISFNGVVVLNEATAFLLNQLTTPKSEEELTAILMDEYEVDEETAKRDIQKTFMELIEIGVVSE